jgi:hypothetical protein
MTTVSDTCIARIVLLLFQKNDSALKNLLISYIYFENKPGRIYYSYDRMSQKYVNIIKARKVSVSYIQYANLIIRSPDRKKI